MESTILERYRTFKTDVIAWFYSFHLVTLVLQVAEYQPTCQMLRPLVSLVRYAFVLCMIPFIGLVMCLVAAILPFILTWFIVCIVLVLPFTIPIAILVCFCYFLYQVYLTLPGLMRGLYNDWSSFLGNVLDRVPILMSVVDPISYLLHQAITCLQYLRHQQALCCYVIRSATHLVFNPMESLSLLTSRLENLLWSVFIETPRNYRIRAVRRLQYALNIPSCGLIVGRNGPTLMRVVCFTLMLVLRLGVFASKFFFSVFTVGISLLRRVVFWMGSFAVSEEILNLDYSEMFLELLQHLPVIGNIGVIQNTANRGVRQANDAVNRMFYLRDQATGQVWCIVRAAEDGMQLFVDTYADLPREVLMLLLRDYLMNGPVDKVSKWFRENLEIPVVLTDMVTHSISNITLGAFDGSLFPDMEHQ